MRIGILTDIHEAVEEAAEAIRVLREQNVDEIVCLGDFCEMGTRLAETCELLLRERIRCVWGNHDFGLCEQARQGAVERHPPVVAEFARTVVPRIQIGDLLFTHVEPWLDPNEITDLWHFDGVPDTAEKRDRIFADQGWRIAFAGHYHTWLAISASSPDVTIVRIGFEQPQQLDWTGTTPLDLPSGRHFIVVDACMDGHFAVFDTESNSLTPSSWLKGDGPLLMDTIAPRLSERASTDSAPSLETGPFATLAGAIREGNYGAPEDSIPERLNHYQLIEKLGAGGTSNIWRAEHVYLKQQVAVKVLRQDVASRSLEYAERFLREAQALAIMRGPGVRAVQDAAIHANIPYVVTELLVGNTVHDHVRKHGPLTINQTMDLLEQVGEVLIRQEECGILHRDIKPGNIWLREDGSFCLFDYGLVGFDKHSQKFSVGLDVGTQIGTVMGTPVYMAPEQMKGMEIDHRTDLFGLGATAYQCLTGKSARDITQFGSLSNLLKEAWNKPIPSPREHRKDITPEFERILRSLTALDPDERYGTAREFVQDLEAYRYGRQRPYGATSGSAFVAMPFSPAFKQMYEFLQDVCGEARLAARKVDRVTQMHDIWGQIESEIRLATVVIAVFTREKFSRWPNANVMTEAAHARAVGRPLIVLTTDRAEKLPFDWRHLPIIRYRNSKRGLAEMREELLPRLKQVLRDRRTGSKPK